MEEKISSVIPRKDISSFEPDLPLPMSFFNDFICASGGEEKSIDFFNFNENKKATPDFKVDIEIKENVFRIYGITFIPPEHMSITTNSPHGGHGFILMHLPTLSITKSFTLHEEPCWRVNYIPELSKGGRTIVSSSSGDGTIGVWNIHDSSKSPIAHFKKVVGKKDSGHGKYVRECIYFKKTEKFISCSEDHTIYSWNLKNSDNIGGDKIFEFPGDSAESYGLYSLEKNEDLGILLVGSSNSKIFVLSPKNPKKSRVTATVNINEGSIWDIITPPEYSANRFQFVAGCFNSGFIHIYDLRRLDTSVFSNKVHKSTIYRLSKINSKIFASGSNDREIKIFPYSLSQEDQLKDESDYRINYKIREDGYVYGLTSFLSDENDKDSVYAVRDRVERMEYLLVQCSKDTNSKQCISRFEIRFCKKVLEIPKIFIFF